jgi:hypothetical protein
MFRKNKSHILDEILRKKSILITNNNKIDITYANLINELADFSS